MSPDLRRTLTILGVGLLIVVGAIWLLLRVDGGDEVVTGDAQVGGSADERIAAVRERLLELSVAQDTFRRHYGVYGRSVGQMRFEVPRGMTIEIIGSTTEGWAAQASVQGVDRLCAIFVGDSAAWVFPPAQRPGEPACSPPRGSASTPAQTLP